MTSRAGFAISVFSVAVALSLDVCAAQETPAAGQTAYMAPTISATTIPTTPRHSHMTEKRGVPAEQAASSHPDDKTAAKETSRLKQHDHQRDMK